MTQKLTLTLLCKDQFLEQVKGQIPKFRKNLEIQPEGPLGNKKTEASASHHFFNICFAQLRANLL